jgi:hypothetical protein
MGDVKANSDNVWMVFEMQAQLMISYRKCIIFVQSYISWKGLKEGQLVWVSSKLE